MIAPALRHDWPVRWAHHPLCARHAHETWRIGRLHLCRGCTSLLAGALSAAFALAAAGAWVPWTLALLAPPVLVLSWPPRYARLPRALRDVLRCGAGAMPVLAAWTTWHHLAQAWPLLPLLFVFWRVYARIRIRVMARRCDGCPELGRGRTCSGYALQAACQRAIEASLEARLGDALAGEGPPPRRLVVPRR